MWVGPPRDNRQPDFDVIRNTGHADNALSIILGLLPLAVAADEAGKRDNAVFYGDGNVGRVDVGVPAQFIFYVALDIAIRSHETSSATSQSGAIDIGADAVSP